MAKAAIAKRKIPNTAKRTDIRKMTVMVSSRCLDQFPRSSGKQLSETRRALKARLLSAKLFDQNLGILQHSAGAAMTHDTEIGDLKAIEASVNDATRRVGALWIAFVVFGTCLVIAVGSVRADVGRSEGLGSSMPSPDMHAM